MLRSIGIRGGIVLVACLRVSLALGQVTEPFGEREWMTGELARRQAISLQQESGITPDQMLEAWRARNSDQKFSATATGLPTFSWEFLGPENQSGHVQALAAIPGSMEILAGASGGGIWKFSKDSVWRNKTDNFPSLKISTAAASSAQKGLYAMGTREGFVYLSTDSGTSWAVAAKAPGANIMSLAFSPQAARVIYAATDAGLMRSTNLGGSWTSIGAGRARSVILDPTNPASIYYAKEATEWPNSSVNLMHSNDAGATFTPIYHFSTGYYSDVLFSMCKAHPLVMWAGSDSSHTYVRSEDGGVTWQQCVTAPYLDSYNNGFWSFTADPVNPLVAIAGGPPLFRTTDGGKSWARIDSTVHADHHTFIFLGGSRAALGCDGGVYVTEDYMARMPIWRYQSTGLITLEAYNVAGSPDGQDIVITGCQDNGYDKYEADSKKWRVVGGDGFATLYSSKDPNIFYHEYTDMNLHRARDGFTWWSEKVMNGLPTTADFYTGISGAPVDWYGQGITMDPQNSDVLYAGTDSLFKTVDGGDNWKLASTAQLTTGGSITAITVSPIDSMRIFVGSDAGMVSVTSNGGSTWFTVPKAQFAGQQGRIYSIAADPKNVNRAYLSMQVGGSGTPVYATTDGGYTWKARTQGLPKATTSRLLIDTDRPDTLYVGTSLGIYVSLDAGTSWSLMPGLPTVEIRDLEWHVLNTATNGPTRCMLVGTYGRGILRGTPVSPITHPDTLRFASTLVSTTRDSTFAAVITNAGLATQSFESVSIHGLDSARFLILAGGLPFTLQPAESHAVALHFAPKAVAGYHASLEVTQTGTAAPIRIAVEGSGVIPALRMAPAIIDFGSIALSQKKDSSTIITTSGLPTERDSIHISAITIVGVNANAFSITSKNLVFALATGESKQVSVRYTPISFGSEHALLIISNDAIKGLDTVQLMGAGVTSGVSATADLSSPDLQIQCSPNPMRASGIIRMKSSPSMNGKVYSAILLDESGREIRNVRSGRVTESVEEWKLDVNQIASGHYFLEIRLGALSARQAIIVNH